MLTATLAQPLASATELFFKVSVRSPVTFTVGLVSFIFLLQYLLQQWQGSGGASADDLCKPSAYEAGSPAGKRSSTENGKGEAAVGWAGQHGRFKHRGLRPEPLDASRGPPEYSLKPLQLPLPELSAKQAAALRELSERVQDMAPENRTDDSTLVRYLKARQFNVGRTEKYFREAARWRKENGAQEALTQWNLQAYEECLAPWWLSGGFFGHGKKGEMIAYERLARSDWAGMVRRMPWKDIVKLDIVHCMRSLAACEEDCLRREVPMGDGILIQDCHGFGWDQASLAASGALNKLVENRNKLMPECLTKILVIRAPAAWVYAWKMFSYILDPGIREKVQVAGERNGESLALLRKYIDDEAIPAYLGGKKHVEGDLECKKVLAPGGRLPEEALQRFLKLVSEGPMENKGDGACDEKPRRWSPCVQRESPEEEGDDEIKRARSCCW